MPPQARPDLPAHTNDSKASGKRSAVSALTGVRFIAASWVLVLHTSIPDTLLAHGKVRLGNLLIHGGLAVTLFFLLSGFILSYNYRDRLHVPGSWLNFWEARVARIWPVYAFSLLLNAVLSGFQLMPKPLYAVGVLLMLQSWVPGNQELGGLWNMVAWTISVEFFFYLLMPVIQVQVDRWKPRTLWLTLALCILINIAGDCSAHRFDTGDHHSLMSVLPLPLVRLPEFLIGMLIANLLLVPGGFRNTNRYGLLTWSSVVLALALLTQTALRQSFVVIPFAMLLMGLATERTLLSRVLSTRLLLFGGAVSYSLYLLQVPARYLARLVMGLFGIHSEKAVVLSIPVLLLAISIPTYLLLEEPARKGLRKLFALRKQHAAAA